MQCFIAASPQSQKTLHESHAGQTPPFRKTSDLDLGQPTKPSCAAFRPVHISLLQWGTSEGAPRLRMCSGEFYRLCTWAQFFSGC